MSKGLVGQKVKFKTKLRPAYHMSKLAAFVTWWVAEGKWPEKGWRQWMCLFIEESLKNGKENKL